MKPETRGLLSAIAASVLYTGLLVSLFSGALYLYNGKILSNVLITTGTVLGVGYLFNLFTIQRFNRFVASKEAEILKEQQKIMFPVECCNCNKVRDVLIDFTQDMIFTCDECDTPNKIFYIIKTGRPTEIPKNSNVIELIDEMVDNGPKA